MNLVRNAASVLATQAATIAIHLPTSIILARYLSVEDRGLYAVAIAFASMAALVVELGWGPAVIFRLRRAASPPAQVATATLAAALVLSSIAVIGCLSLEGWITHRLLDDAPREVFLLALAVIPMQLTWIVFASVARGMDRFGVENLLHVSIFTTRLFGTVGVLVLFPGRLREALLVYLASEMLGASAIFASMVRATGLRRRVDVGEIRESLVFGLKAFVTRLSSMLSDRFDLFMIAYFLGDPTQAAFYAIAVTLTSQLKLLPEAVGRALYPQLAGTDMEATGRLTAKTARHTLLWVAMILVVLAAVAPWAIPLVYGAPYASSLPPFMVLLPGMALFSMYRLFSNYFTAVGRQRANMQTQVVATVVNVLLNIVLIPRLGILGAALANVCSNATGALLITFAFRQDTGMRWRDFLVARRDDLGVYQRALHRLRPALRRAG